MHFLPKASAANLAGFLLGFVCVGMPAGRLLADAYPPPFLLAQTVEPISGGAGYLGAGLLGIVLTWLLWKHLPDKDRQIEKLITDKDKLIESLVGRFDAALTLQRNTCRAEVAIEREIFRAESAEQRRCYSEGCENLAKAFTTSVGEIIARAIRDDRGGPA